MKLHHIGYIVNNISEYERNLLFENKIKEIYDPIQNSQMALYNNYGSAYIELIHPMNTNSFTYNFLKKNGHGYHHLCYEVADREEIVKISKDYKLITIKGPLPAILFDNREVWFYFTRNKQVIEFVI